MNRAQRRAADRAKPIHERVVPVPRAFDEFAVFHDIEAILAKISSGKMDFAEGDPVFKSSSGEWCAVIPALDGWVRAWDRFNVKFNLGHDVSPLARMVNQLRHDMLILPHTLKAAKLTVAEQRRLFKIIPREELASVARTEQIALLLEDIA